MVYNVHMDALKNFGKVTVSTGYDNDDTSIVLTTGHGANLPDPSTDGNYNLVWWNSTDYPDPADDPNKEIVRVTGKSTDTLTVVRPAVGNSYNGETSANAASNKNTGGKVYKMILALTYKVMTGIRDSKGAMAIVGTEENCDFTSIQSAIDYVNGLGGGKVHIRAGTYSLSANLQMYSDIILEGEGKGATLLVQASGINGDVINCNSVDRWTIRDLDIDGNVSNNASGDNGIVAYDADLWLVENCVIHHNKLKGIAIGDSSYGWTVRDTELHTNSQDGMAMASGTTAGGKVCQNGTIMRVYSTNNTLYGMGLVTPANTYARTKNIKIIGCDIIGNGSYGIECFGVLGTIIEGNTISGNGNHGVDLGSNADAAYKAENVIVIGNVVKNGSQAGIHLQDCYDSIIEGNRCYDDQGSPTQTYGISGNGAGGARNRVKDNLCKGNLTAACNGTPGWDTLPNNDTTPDITGFKFIFASNGSGTTITNLDGSHVAGDVIHIVATNGNTTLNDTGNMKLTGNITLGTDDSLSLIFNGTNWIQLATANN